MSTQTQTTPAATVPQSDYYAGWDACFFGKPLDSKQSTAWQRGWRSALDAEAEATMPRKKVSA